MKEYIEIVKKIGINKRAIVIECILGVLGGIVTYAGVIYRVLCDAKGIIKLVCAIFIVSLMIDSIKFFYLKKTRSNVLTRRELYMYILIDLLNIVVVLVLFGLVLNFIIVYNSQSVSEINFNIVPERN